jgi:mannan polymerase II complex MNN11 subunit
LVLVAILGLIWVLSGRSQEEVYREYVPSGKPPIVIVTVIDPTSYSATYLKSIQENRRRYAEKHGTVSTA